MADFERNLATMTACEGPLGGYHMLAYRSAGHSYLEPIRRNLGNQLPHFQTPGQVAALLGETASGTVPACSAIDIFRMCQRELHINGKRTEAYSSRMERVGSVVLASQEYPVRIQQSLLKPSRFPGVYHTARLFDAGEDLMIPPEIMVQDRLRTKAHRDMHKLVGMVLADMSRPGHQVYVGIWNEETDIVPLP